MAIRNLHDVLMKQLQDLASACRQSHRVTTELANVARDVELQQALFDGLKGISDGIETLGKLCERHSIEREVEHCKGMEGLASEARLHAIEADFADAAVRDAVIITQYQRMVHYALAGYGSAVAFARRLGLDEDADELQRLLDDTYDGDRRMTRIATEGSVNFAAA